VLRVDRRLDLAVLAVPRVQGRPVLASAEGDALSVLVRRPGGARALPARLRRRIVATLDTAGGATAARRPGLELAAAIGPGDSGAPVLTRGGAVAGVVFARSTRRPGTAYAVSGAALTALLGAPARPEARRG
jgi:S1-C subfamily serine protease